jgi:hypothetical protein
MPNAVVYDLTGQRFGRLVAVAYSKPSKWICLCDCGNKATVLSSLLRKGATKSCGCLRRDKTVEQCKSRTKHGMYKTPEYQAWANMLYRCTSPSCHAWESYGGRGIAVCERWKSFENFYADMGQRPHGTSLDRIDNNGNYEPSNCAWRTYKEQQNNRRTSRVIEYNGKRMTLSQWSRETGIPISTLFGRLETHTSTNQLFNQTKRN